MLVSPFNRTSKPRCPSSLLGPHTHPVPFPETACQGAWWITQSMPSHLFSFCLEKQLSTLYSPVCVSSDSHGVSGMWWYRSFLLAASKILSAFQYWEVWVLREVDWTEDMKWSLTRNVKRIKGCDCDGMETFNSIGSHSEGAIRVDGKSQNEIKRRRMSLSSVKQECWKRKGTPGDSCSPLMSH